METQHHHWHSPRLGLDMGVAVYGHYGLPLLAFPTSGGDEWEMANQRMVRTLAPFIEEGRVKLFCTRSASQQSFYNRDAHPFHRSWMQRQYDDYVRWEVVPFIHGHCQNDRVPISTMGMSLGAYHAANTLFKHPDVVKRCFALSGIYDMRRFMDGQYDENFYFNNPVDYLANLSDTWYLEQLASCDIHIATGCGPWETPGPSWQLSDVLRQKGIPHHLDDWGPEGGHDWPHWHHMMWEYVRRYF
jgi:esterase/lipase superfamily enzyme